MKFRKMIDSDSRAVADLAIQLGYPNTSEDILRRFSEISSLRDHSIIVAEDESREIIGWMHLQVHLSLVANSRVEISALVVDEKLRGKGIGQKFLLEAERWANEKGNCQLRLSSNIQRAEAHRFYQRHGYENKKTSHIFSKAIEANGKSV